MDKNTTLHATDGPVATIPPTIAIVGRPNVGKSTLFNRLVGGRQAIVEDMPGVTRDRQYGEGEILGRRFVVIDTGGLEPKTDDQIFREMKEQSGLAMDEADVILCVFDGQAGLMPQDREIALMLQRGDKPVFWVINKIDGPRHDIGTLEFYELGIEEMFPISAQHSGGTLDLMEAVFEVLPEERLAKEIEGEHIRVAIVGKPNVGKSTLLNRMIGEERMIVSDTPGTTRDAIDTPLVKKGPDGEERQYLLIDTAGVRRRKWIKSTVEKISVVRTFKAIDRAEVCLFIIDATEEISEQDKRLAALIEEKGRACIVLVNKWDAVENKDDRTFGEKIQEVRDALGFIGWAPVLTISGLSGQRTHRILDEVDKVHRAYSQRIKTSELNQVFERILQTHQPPIRRGKRLKIYYASQVATSPPRIVLWCNDPEAVHTSYQRFLINQVRQHWNLEGTPVRIYFRPRSQRTSVPVSLEARVQEAEEMGAQTQVDWGSDDDAGWWDEDDP